MKPIAGSALHYRLFITALVVSLTVNDIGLSIEVNLDSNSFCHAYLFRLRVLKSLVVSPD
ncbi:hypothetical protein [[Flexibacter] sp. ATCC 35208]|uniref:hypothetical protein n=1 Tax=[Flexibacter] sp. ATCC 35208 TaxID=1936242 RepID=UPI00117F4620|nr:hypothetical protein [[Flexibacter] sp. ATCC 35208]